MISLWTGIEPHEAEARLRGLNRRLAELDQAMTASQHLVAENPDSFAAKLSLGSLTQLQERLQSERIELVQYRHSERLQVALKGHSYNDHTANIGQLGVFLIRLQKLYTSIGQAITTGPRQRGPVSYELLRATNLRFADVYPSSFGMEIYIESGFDLLGESTSVSALQSLFNLLNATSREVEISRLSAELGQRSLNHLKHMLANVAKADAGFALSWIDGAGTQYEWSALKEEVPRLRENVSKYHERRTVEKQVTGYLIGASLLRDRFEFATVDREIIEGKIAKTAKYDVRECFGQKCNLIIDQTDIVNNNTSESRTYYVMTKISRFEQTY